VVEFLHLWYMDNLQQLELIDKIQRELKDLEQSQVSVLKKVSQIAAHNITLNAEVLNQKLPDLEGNLEENLTSVKELSESFDAYREKYFSDHKMSAQVDPTA
jgi:methyl-accepting chemotaxis protein